MFHKVHHEFNHTLTIAFIYVHPIEYIFCNLMVSYSAIWIVSFLYGRESIHYTTTTIWLNLRIAETLDGHSGFVFPKPVQLLLGNFMALNPILGTEPRYHNYHHSKNMSNFGTFFIIWDTVFGSNKEYYKMIIRR